MPTAKTKVAEPVLQKTTKPKLKGTTKGLGVSLKGGIKTQKNNQVQEEGPQAWELTDSNAPQESFDQTQLERAWTRFCDTLTQPSEQLAKSMLQAAEYSIQTGAEVLVYLHSKTQEKEWHQIRPRLIPFLRQELRNGSLKISTKVDAKKTKSLPYTPEEKYQHMLEKHPDLEAFRKKLHLDLGH